MLPPTPEIQTVLKLIEELLNRLKSESSKIQISGDYQSDITIANLLKLLVRNVESILCLARHDLLLLPSALVIARTVLETAANILWLMQPEDMVDREIRLIYLLRCENEQREKYIKNLIELGVDKSELEVIESQKEEVQKYCDAIKSRIPSGYTIEEENKLTVESLLASLNLKNVYPTYRTLCSFTHANHAATWIYKRTLPQGDKFGEHIEPRDWHTPLSICSWVLEQFRSEFRGKFGGGIEEFLPEAMHQEVQQALERILSS